MKPGEMKIVRALMDHEGGLTFTDLKKETGLSAPVLSEYLKQFQTTLYITRDANRNYRLRKTFFKGRSLPERERAMKMIVSTCWVFGLQMKRIKDKNRRKELMVEFLKTYFLNAFPLMTWSVFHHSLDEWQKVHTKGKEAVNELHMMLKSQIDNWIIPLIQQLTIVMIANFEDIREFEGMAEELNYLWRKGIEEYLEFLKENQRVLGIEGKTLREMMEELIGSR